MASLPPEIRERRVAAGGLTTRVLEAGSGPDVLLIHGIPTHAELWRGVMAALAPTHHVIAPDLPGLGQAERPLDFDYSFVGLGRWIVALVDALGLKRFHLGLHDLGGAAGAALLRERTEQVRSLLVYNTVLLAGFRPPKIVRRTVRVPVLGELLLSPFFRPFFIAIMARLANARRPLDVREWRERYLRPILDHPNGVRVTLRIFRSMDGAHLAGGVEKAREARIPARIIWGRRDPFLTARGAERIHAALPGSELVFVESASHFLQDDAPEEVARLTAEFIREQEVAPAGAPTP